MTAHPQHRASGIATEGRAAGELPDASSDAASDALSDALPDGAGAAGARRRGSRRWVVAGLTVVLAAAGVTGAWRAGVFGPAGRAGSRGSAYPTPTAVVTQQDLSSQTTVDATLGYAGSYTVFGKGGGTLTWLPSPGQVIRQGRALYRVDNGTPVVLLYGKVPAWRALSEGQTGADVAQLNHDLVALGYADSADISALGWDYFSWETMAGVERLQSALGITSPSGSLALGSAVFEPGALRVASIADVLGNPAAGPVVTATSARHVVTISLNAAQQSEVAVGDRVTVTLPDGATTPGTISSVGAVASGSGGSATIPVTVALTDPASAGHLDQAPVTVAITNASVRDALVVPVGALLAQSSGGYAVELVGAGGLRHLVPVKVGIFDDTDGLVQVSGDLTAGQHVVVPAT